MTNIMMRMLEKTGVPTHFVEELSDRDTLVRRVQIVPLEVIVRNISAGSFAKRYGVAEVLFSKRPPWNFRIRTTTWATRS
jgi:phosphoribosylaminoimidazole-succinocarboxamide synthase